MVQKQVTAQGWLGSRPEGQRPQIRGLRAGGSLAVASSIPATQLSSPARLAERVVTPHAPMTLGANHVSRAQKGGDPAASGDLRLGHRAPGRGGRRATPITNSIDSSSISWSHNNLGRHFLEV